MVELIRLGSRRIECFDGRIRVLIPRGIDENVFTVDVLRDGRRESFAEYDCGSLNEARFCLEDLAATYRKKP